MSNLGLVLKFFRLTEHFPLLVASFFTRKLAIRGTSLFIFKDLTDRHEPLQHLK